MGCATCIVDFIKPLGGCNEFILGYVLYCFNKHLKNTTIFYLISRLSFPNALISVQLHL